MLSEIRLEIDRKAKSHNHSNYVFLTNDGLDVVESDESKIKIAEVVFANDLGKDQISVKCRDLLLYLSSTYKNLSY